MLRASYSYGMSKAINPQKRKKKYKQKGFRGSLIINYAIHKILISQIKLSYIFEQVLYAPKWVYFMVK